jgi:hypothetical protein
VTDHNRDQPRAQQPSALPDPLPGLAWTQAVVEGTRRAQAALAAGTLRQLSAPVAEALAKHREIASALADTARQMSTMSRHVAELARQHGAVTAQLQKSMEPYLRYVEWLDRESAGQPATDD